MLPIAYIKSLDYSIDSTELKFAIIFLLRFLFPL
jgi:hypothetical protein